MVRTYFQTLLKLAARSSWIAANGLFGAAIAGVALVWPGIWKFSSGTEWWADAVNWLSSFVIYAAVAWIIILVFQFVFVAPFQLWRDERNRVESLAAAAQSREDRAEEKLQHDRKLARQVRELFPETEKQKLTSSLENDHAYWDLQGNRLSDAIHFLASAEAHFLDDTLQTKAKEFVQAGANLLNFLAYKFFVYPSEQRERPLRFAMQPSWNVDREGDGSREQQNKYDALTTELEGRAELMSETYDELIRAFHTQLLE